MHITRSISQRKALEKHGKELRQATTALLMLHHKVREQETMFRGLVGILTEKGICTAEEIHAAIKKSQEPQDVKETPEECSSSSDHAK